MATELTFEILNSINNSKENLLKKDKHVWNDYKTGLEKTVYPKEDDYVPFLINRWMGSYPDTIFFANAMNYYYELPITAQYEFYLKGISPAKRFSKWNKVEKFDKIELIQKFYGVSKHIAVSYMDRLTDKDYAEMELSFSEGGFQKIK